jgi:hypothetical protein
MCYVAVLPLLPSALIELLDKTTTYIDRPYKRIRLRAYIVKTGYNGNNGNKNKEPQSGKTPEKAVFMGGFVLREKTLERKLVEAVKAMGGIAPKFTSPGFDGMPDRLVLLPLGRIAFVEVKRHGEKPRLLQVARHGMLLRLGFQVYVLDDRAQISEILKQMGGDAE